jgi:hypothetical protein
MAPASSPAEISQELSAIIDGSAQRALEFARTCPVGGTPQMMEVFLAKIDEYVWQFQQEAPLANWLRQQGMPAPASKLDTDHSRFGHCAAKLDRDVWGNAEDAKLARKHLVWSNAICDSKYPRSDGI